MEEECVAGSGVDCGLVAKLVQFVGSGYLLVCSW